MEETYTLIPTKFSIQILETGWIHNVVLKLEIYTLDNHKQEISLPCSYLCKMKQYERKVVKLQKRKHKYISRIKRYSIYFSVFQASYTFDFVCNGSYYFNYSVNGTSYNTDKTKFIVYD